MLRRVARSPRAHRPAPAPFGGVLQRERQCERRAELCMGTPIHPLWLHHSVAWVVCQGLVKPTTSTYSAPRLKDETSGCPSYGRDAEARARRLRVPPSMWSGEATPHGRRVHFFRASLGTSVGGLRAARHPSGFGLVAARHRLGCPQRMHARELAGEGSRGLPPEGEPSPLAPGAVVSRRPAGPSQAWFGSQLLASSGLMAPARPAGEPQPPLPPA